MKKIEDYLHYYMGCDVETTVQGEYVHPTGTIHIDRIDDDSYESLIFFLKRKAEHQKQGFNDYDWVEVKPILRTVDSMTDEEARELFRLEFGDEEFNKIMLNFRFGSYSAESFHYLTRNGFDIFGLIEAGLAIQAITF